MKTARLLLTLVFAFSIAGLPALATGVSRHQYPISRAEKFIRTELYFGLTKPDKSTLSSEDWSLFVDEIITPRFPDGFTVIDGAGQWRNKNGQIAKESTKIFIVVYPRRERGSAGKKIDEIRNEYKKRFEQESVLRVDIRKTVEVSF